MKRMMKNKKGFTLIELLVVLLILGVLVGLGVPRYMEAQKVARFNTFAANVRGIAEALDNYVVMKQVTATTYLEGTASTNIVYPKDLQALKDAGLISQDFINPYTKVSMLSNDPTSGIYYQVEPTGGYTIFIRQKDVDDIDNDNNIDEYLFDVNPSMFPTTAKSWSE